MGSGAPVKPLRLLLAPFIVWSAAGLVLLFDGRHAMDYFPYLWAANDIAIMIAFAGVMMHLFGSGGRAGPTRDEWTDWKPDEKFDLPLEDLLVLLAKRIEAEAPLR